MAWRLGRPRKIDDYFWKSGLCFAILGSGLNGFLQNDFPIYITPWDTKLFGILFSMGFAFLSSRRWPPVHKVQFCIKVNLNFCDCNEGDIGLPSERPHYQLGTHPTQPRPVQHFQECKTVQQILMLENAVILEQKPSTIWFRVKYKPENTIS